MQQNFSTKTCHIMVPKDRDFNKDSKKIFICYFRIFLKITINFQSSLQKGNNKTRNCRWVPKFTLGSLERNQTFNRVLHRTGSRGALPASISGEQRPGEQGESWGKKRGSSCAPLDSFSAARGGRMSRLRELRRPAVVGDGEGSALAKQ